MSHCEARLNPPDYAYHRPRMQLVRVRCMRRTDIKERGHYICGVCAGSNRAVLFLGNEEVISHMFTFGSLFKDAELPELVPGKPHYVMSLHHR